MTATSPRVALVTNLCTHYRRPLFERLRDRFDTDFFFTSDGGESYWLPEHRIDTDVAGAAAHAGTGALLQRLRHGRYDCVVAGLVGRRTLLEAAVAARRSRAALVLWVGIWKHPQTLLHRCSRPWTRRLLRRADAVIVYGPHVAAHVAREAGRTTGVVEAPQAVDNDLFRQPVDAGAVAAVRAGLAAPGDVMAAFVGRLEPEKGIEVLLRALALAPARLKLAIIGTGSFEPAIRGLAESLGVSSRVRLVGYVPQERLPLHLHAADFLVVPSISTKRFKEPWGLVCNEAMNCGLPVVATDAVGAAAGGLVVHRQTGIVARERDVSDLAEGLSELALDAGLRRDLGTRAREHVLAWSYDRAADAFEGAVRHACEAKRSGA